MFLPRRFLLPDKIQLFRLLYITVIPFVHILRSCHFCAARSLGRGLSFYMWYWHFLKDVRLCFRECKPILVSLFRSFWRLRNRVESYTAASLESSTTDFCLCSLPSGPIELLKDVDDLNLVVLRNISLRIQKECAQFWGEATENCL